MKLSYFITLCLFFIILTSCSCTRNIDDNTQELAGSSQPTLTPPEPEPPPETDPTQNELEGTHESELQAEESQIVEEEVMDDAFLEPKPESETEVVEETTVAVVQEGSVGKHSGLAMAMGYLFEEIESAKVTSKPTPTPKSKPKPKPKLKVMGEVRVIEEQGNVIAGSSPAPAEQANPISRPKSIGKVLAAPSVPVMGGIIVEKAYPKIMEIGTPPKNSIAENDLIWSRLMDANITYNHPEKMNIEDDPVTIQLVLSLKKSIEELSEIIKAPGKIEGEQIKTSGEMEARLSGPGFQITAITNEKQLILSEDFTEWKWMVKPISTGTQRLHLTLTAKLNSSSKSRTVRTFDKTILVEVTFFQKASMFIEGNWQWIWAALIIPIATWFWKKRDNIADSDHPK